MFTTVPPPVFPGVGVTDVIVGRRYVNPFTSVAVVPLGFVTTTFTLFAACAGVVTLRKVSLPETFVADTPPNVTVAPALKPIPLIFTAVPPAVFPELGLTDVIDGRAYVNPFTLVTEVAFGFVTTTSTLPAACAGVSTEIIVSSNEVIVASTPPNVTFAPGAKPPPLMTTFVPPLVFPVVGEIEVIVGRT
jgi:hypothetical protein